MLSSNPAPSNGSPENDDNYQNAAQVAPAENGPQGEAEGAENHI